MMAALAARGAALSGCRLFLSSDDHHLVALRQDPEQLGRERFRHTDTAMCRKPPTHIATVDRDAVVRQSKRIGHRRIAVGRRAMILQLGKDRKLARWRRETVSTIKNNCS